MAARLRQNIIANRLAYRPSQGGGNSGFIRAEKFDSFYRSNRIYLSVDGTIINVFPIITLSAGEIAAPIHAGIHAGLRAAGDFRVGLGPGRRQPPLLPHARDGLAFGFHDLPGFFLAHGNVSDPPGITRDDRRRLLNGVQALNREQLADVGDPEIATRISQYEMAFRMQSSVPELMDLAGEKIETLELYGAKPGQASFANNCLLARRLVERGVRFVQLFHADWDTHSNIETGLPARTKEVDQPMAALVADLKQRGLLDETLVVWGAEFGRTPMMQGTDDEDKPASKPGRDHHKDAFSVWMAGGGVKPGVTVGRTDDLGYTIVEDPVHVNDFHATLLHLLGIDHERLTFKFQGRPYRLTDVAGEVVRKLRMA